MKEDFAGRLELSCSRARAMFGADGPGANLESASSVQAPRWPGEEDAQRIAERISAASNMAPPAALAIALDLVDLARAALEKKHVSEQDAFALEAVIQVRGRPALRIENAHLESLEHFRGSELWQDFITDYEAGIVTSAGSTGGVFVDAFASGNPRWLQGSAWLIAPDRVVTNRHVLFPKDGIQLIELGSDETKACVREGFKIDVDFTAQDGNPVKPISRRVSGVLFVARPRDPVDIAVLAIEPNAERKALVLANAADPPPKNLYVVGHPALGVDVPDKVKSVFGNLDGRKRVSFGQLLPLTQQRDLLVHDASTVGGYSGGPVMGIREGRVAGLHYYGDPMGGNLAVSAAALQSHPVHQYLALAQ